MQLSIEQKQSFVRDGFLPLPGIVPREKVEAAVRAINHSLGEGIDPALMWKFRAQTFCPDVSGTPAISDLLNETPLFGILESLLGEGNIPRAGGGQIALRFPGHGVRDESAALPAPHPHLDGMYSPTNGVQEGTISNFSALVGVLLSDVPHENMGNFTVWPGSPQLYENYFRENGPESLFQGMPRVDLPAPQQITGRAGDAVLCHYQMGHGIAPNVSPYIRYAIFFRIKHRDHASHSMEVMSDIWRDWPGVQAELATQR